MQEVIIQAKKLRKSYQTGKTEVPVINSLDLELYKGDFTVIMGSSGSGKSTLLYLLSGLEVATGGEVWLEGKALGKPKDEQDAFKMFRDLSGKKHEVITSISIKNINFQKIISDTTVVSFKDISDEEINYYIKNYKPFDKAGAYGIQEWIGFIAINNIEGSYFNVVGLPVHKLYKELMDL